MIKFYCQHCEQKLSATEEIFGTNIHCPACNNLILVPEGPKALLNEDVALNLLNETEEKSESKVNKTLPKSQELENETPREDLARIRKKTNKSFAAKNSSRSPRAKSRVSQTKQKKRLSPIISCLALGGLILGGFFFKDSIFKNPSKDALTNAENDLQVLANKFNSTHFSKDELLAQKDIIMKIKPFMEAYCFECHNEEKQKGEIRLDNIDFKMTQHDSIYMWQDILDVLNVGEMPPKKSTQPHTNELSNSISLITEQLLLARKRLSSTGGVIAMRHLNKREYYGSVEDLIGFKLLDHYLDDDLSPRFDTNGSDQFFSSRNYETYMNVGKSIMKEALKVYASSNKATKSRFQPAKRAYDRQKKSLQKLEKTMALIESGASIEKIGLGDAGQVKLFTKRYKNAVAGPTKYLALDQHKTGVTSEFTPRFGRSFPLKPGAKYIYRIHASSKNDASLKVYAKDKMIGTLDLKASTKPQTYEFSFSTDILDPRPRVGFDMGHFKGIYVEYEEIEGPFESQTSFAENLLRPLVKKKTINDFELRQTLTSFAQRAFRYQEYDEEFINALVAIYQSGIVAKKSQIDALATPLAMILSSPSFLYIKESGSSQRTELKQNEFAIRMAYFLWGAPPDEELYQLAHSNKLYNANILKAQFNRMIQSPKAHGFLESFINQWIGMSRYDEVDLPNKLLGDFQKSARRELGEFFKVLVQENLPLDNLIDSDFIVVNKTLADYYKIKGDISDFQKVALPANNPRGGLLGQAAFHIMGSAAERTSPSIRGTLIRETLLHNPPPPPPANVPEIDNTRKGDFTVRDLVKHHQSLAQCASCHAKIDPVGLALENFDYLGKWRDHEIIGQEKRGRKKSKGKKLAIDASGYISKNEQFQDLNGFKNALMNNKNKLAESLYSAMLAYGIGREIEFIDEDEIDKNLNSLSATNYPARDMIFQLINSQTFRTK
ncbi:DUF1588 domain-containing protein [Lentisphaera marina]|uniref:DUF1592 domain-containing protein n=1 Tax=Lentisphaera marina TaxID=1111041 RepID=UPI00236638EF|nr:DUF1592 domain-containing protein [Lentisphaera marina]MDD7983967.1 DUF1588 domain-containing protein [Lentisphaera marina]